MSLPDQTEPGPDCGSCHTPEGRPHTEYCHYVDFESQLTHAELWGEHDVEPMTFEELRAWLASG